MDYINGETWTKRYSICLDKWGEDIACDFGRLISYNVDPGVGTWVLRGAHKLVIEIKKYP